MIIELRKSDILDNEPCSRAYAEELWDRALGKHTRELEVDWTLTHTIWLAKIDGRTTKIGAVAWLERANLIPSLLKGADLSGADLTGASLDLCKLQGADFTNARVASITLQGAGGWGRLKGVRTIRPTRRFLWDCCT